MNSGSSFFLRNEPDDVFIQSGRRRFGFNVRDETVLVFRINGIFDDLIGSRHGIMAAATMLPMRIQWGFFISSSGSLAPGNDVGQHHVFINSSRRIAGSCAPLYSPLKDKAAQYLVCILPIAGGYEPARFAGRDRQLLSLVSKLRIVPVRPMMVARLPPMSIQMALPLAIQQRTLKCRN